MRVLTLCLVLSTSVGCSAGSAFTICPNEHKLSYQTACLAASARRCDPIPRELQKVNVPDHHIQPGDSVFLEVTDLDADLRLPVDQTVMPDGTIDLGEYGRLQVAGLTVEQTETAVLNEIRMQVPDKTIKPISVRLINTDSAVYYVLGEVNAPGSFPLTGHETVLDAILAAGGLSDRASSCEIVLSRPNTNGCRVVLPVCYDSIVQLADTTTNFQVMPGDRIFIATRSIWQQLMFWKQGCDRCPEQCERNCPDATPALTRSSPFASVPFGEVPDLPSNLPYELPGTPDSQTDASSADDEVDELVRP